MRLLLRISPSSVISLIVATASSHQQRRCFSKNFSHRPVAASSCASSFRSLSSTTASASVTATNTSMCRPTPTAENPPAKKGAEADGEKATRTTDANSSSSKSKKKGSVAAVPLNHQRSAQELQALVQLRVRQRESWKVNGAVESAVPPRRVVAKFFLTSMPKYFLFRPPSEQQLDQEFSVLALDWNKLKEHHNSSSQHNNNNSDKIQITWLGHASLLVQMGGLNILTDPVFSDRCSPSQWFGPKRYRSTPCSLSELCQNINIDLVLISHNHYDHLDCNTVRALAHKLAPNAQFVVPLGLQAWFRKNVRSDLNIFELDWHETAVPIHKAAAATAAAAADDSNSKSAQQPTATTVTAVPMRHWSNRTGDRDKTLWCGYRVQTKSINNDSDTQNAVQQKSFLFPGDTAWFDGLHDIVGQRYGPFDVAALPIGAYEPRDFMRHAHINVEEAVRMKRAVTARHAVPIHWGTFPLTTEPVMEPRDKLVQLMKQQQHQDDGADPLSFAPWLIGETKLF